MERDKNGAKCAGGSFCIFITKLPVFRYHFFYSVFWGNLSWIINSFPIAQEEGDFFFFLLLFGHHLNSSTLF